MNADSPELATAWRWGVQSPGRVCGLRAVLPAPKQGEMRSRAASPNGLGQNFVFMLPQDPRLECSFLQFISKLNQHLLSGDLRHGSESLAVPWLRAGSEPSCGLGASCCCHVTELRGLGDASLWPPVAQGPLRPLNLVSSMEICGIMFPNLFSRASAPASTLPAFRPSPPAPTFASTSLSLPLGSVTHCRPRRSDQAVLVAVLSSGDAEAPKANFQLSASFVFHQFLTD